MTASEETSGAVSISIRPFKDEYAAVIAIQKAIDPDEEGSVEHWRFDDEQWRHDRYYKERLVAEFRGRGDRGLGAGVPHALAVPPPQVLPAP